MNQSFVFEKLTKCGGFSQLGQRYVGLPDSVTISDTVENRKLGLKKKRAPAGAGARGTERESRSGQTLRLRRRRMIPAPLMATRPVARSTMLAGSGTGVSVGGLKVPAHVVEVVVLGE
jgi:hypothetical protein